MWLHPHVSYRWRERLLCIPARWGNVLTETSAAPPYFIIYLAFLKNPKRETVDIWFRGRFTDGSVSSAEQTRGWRASPLQRCCGATWRRISLKVIHLLRGKVLSLFLRYLFISDFSQRSCTTIGLWKRDRLIGLVWSRQIPIWMLLFALATTLHFPQLVNKQQENKGANLELEASSIYFKGDQVKKKTKARVYIFIKHLSTITVICSQHPTEICGGG